jgi:N-acetylglucosaminyl-diphospho-decaprenol L-rhamnosyltransferase
VNADRLGTAYAPRTTSAVTAVSVVVVSYQSERHLPLLLSDLAAESRGRLHVIVVDNGSTDDSAKVAAAMGAHVVHTGGNLGYAGALNAAAAHVVVDAPVLVLNPDLRIVPGAVDALLDALTADSATIAVPAIRSPRGTVLPSQRREPRLVRALVDAVLGSRARYLPGPFSEIVWSPAAYRRRRWCDWATGAAILVSAECARSVGRWDDERFFLYSEETDFFRRARRRGHRARFVPEAVVVHEGGGSGTSPDLVALMAVNRVRYFEKHHSRIAAIAFRGLVLLHALLRPHDAGQRRALHALVDRRSWQLLPGRRRG